MEETNNEPKRIVDVLGVFCNDIGPIIDKVKNSIREK
jgi:hypothetical protein